MQLSLDLICEKDFLHRDVTEYTLSNEPLPQPMQNIGVDRDAIWNYILQIEAGQKPVVSVYKEGEKYRVLIDHRELVSAYHYLGYETIPVTVLSPDDMRIPTYVRRGKSLSVDGTAQWN
jgi:hypothetical protein